MLRALIFDFDGLILDTESALIRSYADVHTAHGVPFDEALFIRAVGHVDFKFDPWAAFGPGAVRAELETQRQHTKKGRLEQLAPLPGVVALLNAAYAAGLPVAIASNSEHTWVEPHLDRLGLLDRFTFVACREDAPSPKPEPDLYKLVLNQFGLRAHEAVAFEDSHTGSIAAKRAGLFTVVAPGPSTKHHDFAHVDLRVNSLAEVTLTSLCARFAPPPDA
ncbi:MAG: HAD-IA family hydrolase [Opitutaceae bacterium]